MLSGFTFNPIADYLRQLPSEEMDCLNKINASPMVTAIDQQQLNLAANWNPTGFYTPADIRTVLDTLATEAAKAGQTLSEAPDSTSDAKTVRRQAFDDALRIYRDRSVGFENAYKDAIKNGIQAINAPGFKDFVLGSMGTISNLYVTAAMLSCQESMIQAILTYAYTTAMTIGQVVYKIVGLAVDTIQNFVDVVETGLGFLAWLTKYGPYLAAGVGGLFLSFVVYKKFFKTNHILPPGHDFDSESV